MGGKSTLNSAAFSQQQRNGVPAFDLRSWQGLTYVLKAGKESIKDSHAYAEFRNLVLEYAQKGGDEELRKKIEATTRSFVPAATEEKSIPVPETVKIVPIAQSVEKKETEPEIVLEVKPVQALSKKLNAIDRRLAPSFIPKSVKEVSPEPPVVEPKIEILADAAPLAEEEEDDVPPVLEVIEIEEEKPAEAEELRESTLVPTEIPVVEKTTAAPVAVAEKITVHKTLEEHKTRISEIKRLVHETVGNPAALIDTHNDAGKKYMMALLTALKATSAGSPVSIDTAMASLEEAYSALVSSAKAAPRVEVKKEEPQVVLQKPREEVPLPEKKEIPVPPPPASMKHSPAEIIAALVEDRKRSDIKVAGAAVPKPQAPHSVPEERPAVKPEPVPVPLAPKEKVVQAADQKPANEPVLSVPEPTVQVPKAEASVVAVQKADAEKPLHQSDLFTPEVSRALDGLLHEWKLFSGSGIFGIGPGGTEHPLYQTLAQLSMGEVLAGRWEKADAKAIRVIKEYVDAWRHEQGIAYTINETFEHYLRRVVQRILKRQAQ